MSVKLLTEHHLEFISLKVGYTGSSESTLVKMPHCWKSHVAAFMLFCTQIYIHDYNKLGLKGDQVPMAAYFNY